MTIDDAKTKLSELTERQLEILRLFCDGWDYKSIADELFLAAGTVRVHMGNIYKTLELDIYPMEKRRQILHQVYCQTLKGEDIQPVSTKSEEPTPVPDHIMKMVEDDENAIVLYHQQPLTPPPVKVIDIPSHPPPLRRGGCRPMVIGILIGAILMAVVGYALWRIMDGGGMSPATPEEIAAGGTPIETGVTGIEPTATSQPATEVIMVVTATSPPATDTLPLPPTNTLEPTPLPNTPPGTRLKVGETWKQDGLYLTLSDVRFGTGWEGEVKLSFDIANYTGSDIAVEFHIADVTVEDNNGNRFRQFYDADGQGSSWQEMLTNGQREDVWFYNNTEYTWIGNYSVPNVSYLLVIVRNWSRISEATWQIDIQH